VLEQSQVDILHRQQGARRLLPSLHLTHHRKACSFDTAYARLLITVKRVGMADMGHERQPSRDRNNS
jgi:hypothetical protein